MSNPIDKQDAIDVVKRLMGDYELSRTVQTGLHILPSAQPEPWDGTQDDGELDFVQKHKKIPVELKVSAQPKSEERTAESAQNVPSDELISRKAAIDALRDAENHAFNSFYKGLAKAHKIIADLPSAQQEEAIPLEWIAKHLEWLDNCDNDFAQLAKVAIRAMVEMWKKEKT